MKLTTLMRLTFTGIPRVGIIRIVFFEYSFSTNMQNKHKKMNNIQAFNLNHYQLISPMEMGNLLRKGFMDEELKFESSGPYDQMG